MVLTAFAMSSEAIVLSSEFLSKSIIPSFMLMTASRAF